MPSKNYNSLRSNYPDAEMSSLEVFVIDGKPQVSSRMLELLFNVSARQVMNWQDMGMEKSEWSLPKLKLFDLAYAIKWRNANIKESHSRRTEKQREVKVGKDGVIDERDLPIEEVSKDEAERRQMILKAKNEEIKLKEALGELMPAEDTDRAMAELAAITVANYQSDLKLFPIILENKKRGEIKEILDEHYGERISTTNKLIHKVVDVPNTIFDMILEIVENINMGIKMSVMMKTLADLRSLGSKRNSKKRA